VILFATVAQADDLIPKAAWWRTQGLALENPGTSRVHGDIDDGYSQARRSALLDLALFRGAIAAISPAGI